MVRLKLSDHYSKEGQQLSVKVTFICPDSLKTQILSRYSQENRHATMKEDSGEVMQAAARQGMRSNASQNRHLISINELSPEELKQDSRLHDLH